MEYVFIKLIFLGCIAGGIYWVYKKYKLIYVCEKCKAKMMKVEQKIPIGQDIVYKNITERETIWINNRRNDVEKIRRQPYRRTIYKVISRCQKCNALKEYKEHLDERIY